jgi:hypothetical protein
LVIQLIQCQHYTYFLKEIAEPELINVQVFHPWRISAGPSSSELVAAAVVVVAAVAAAGNLNFLTETAVAAIVEDVSCKVNHSTEWI